MTSRLKTSLLGAVLLGAMLLAWWWFNQRSLITTKHSGTSTYGRTPAGGPAPATSPISSPPPPADATAGPNPLETQQRRFIDAFNTPITFFGQVVDQNGNAVADADVQVAANDKAFGGKPSQHSLRSDAAGKFSITGITGVTLAVEVSKPGYRTIPPADNRVTSNGVFNYGLSSNRGKHKPDPNSPVRFSLHKIGPTNPLYRLIAKDYSIA